MTAQLSTRQRLVAASAIPGAVILSGALVWQTSNAAFSATTANPTSSWSAGTVALSDDDTGTALFSATGLKPGATGTKCIAVTSTGTLPANVRLYGTSYATTNALAGNITFKVEEGTGGNFSGGCGGFTATSTPYNGSLAAFGAGSTSYATGVSTWAPTGSGSETRAYRFTWTLGSSTPDSAQGGTATIGLTWESQNS